MGFSALDFLLEFDEFESESELESESESEPELDESDEDDEELLASAYASISLYFFSKSISFGALARNILRSSVSAPNPIEVK